MMTTIVRATRVAALALAVSLALGLAISNEVAAATPFWSLRGGLSEARLHGGNAGDIASDYRPGPTFGLTANIPVGPAFSIQPELLWIRKGGEGDFNFAGTPGRLEYLLDYLEIPVLARWSVPVGGAIQPYLIAGPSVAYLINNDFGIEFDSTSVSPPPPTPLRYAAIFETVGTFDNPNFRDFDFGAVGGVGAIIGSGPMRLAIEARYEYGFVSIYPDGDGTRNGVIATTLGIEFH